MFEYLELTKNIKGIIYLNTNIDIIKNRIILRNRKEELQIPDNYLYGIKTKHDEVMKTCHPQRQLSDSQCGPDRRLRHALVVRYLNLLFLWNANLWSTTMAVLYF